MLPVALLLEELVHYRVGFYSEPVKLITDY